jgi:hypothetical protein
MQTSDYTDAGGVSANLFWLSYKWEYNYTARSIDTLRLDFKKPPGLFHVKFSEQDMGQLIYQLSFLNCLWNMGFNLSLLLELNIDVDPTVFAAGIRQVFFFSCRSRWFSS